MPVRKLAIKPTKRPGSPHQLLLVGAGYTHLYALAAMIEGETLCPDAAWVVPSRWLYPPGLISGLIAGHYSKEQCRIDLRLLAQKAGIRFIEQTPVALDPDKQALVLDDNTEVGYERLSLDLGEGITDIDLDDLGDNLLRYEAGERFVQGWKKLSDTLAERKGAEVAVVGVGARAVELAMALSESQPGKPAALNITLVSGQTGPLAQYPAGIRQRAIRELEQTGIKLLTARTKLETNQVKLANNGYLSPDALVVVDDQGLPPWLENSGLALVGAGAIGVDASQCSSSHPNVVAMGSISSRPLTSSMCPGKPLAKAGKVLAQNLLAGLVGKRLKPLREHAPGYSLIACPGRRSIGRWGLFTTCSQGKRRKQEAVEKSFIAEFEKIARPLTD